MEVEHHVINGRDLYIVHNVLSPDVCNKIIRDSEASKPLGKVVNTPSSYYRIAFSNPGVLSTVSDAIKKYIPLVGDGMVFDDELRYNKYFAGDFIGIHQDGFAMVGFKVNPHTINIYLNQDFDGGDTVFYSDRSGGELLRVKPRTGSAVIFDCAIFHSGEKILRGTKSIIRANVYQKR
jgi:hypothetical protein